MRGVPMVVVLVLLTGIFGFCIPVGDWELLPYPLIWGAGFSASYSGLQLTEGVDTGISLGVGVVYESRGYYRNPDGSLYDPPRGLFLDKGEAYYDRLNLFWNVGMNQGLIYSDSLGKNLLSVNVLYMGLYLHNYDNGKLLFQSALEDSKGAFQNSLVAGFSLDAVRSNATTNAKQGFGAETSVQATPGFLGNRLFGQADFFRYNLQLKFYLTLFDLDVAFGDKSLNLVFSGRSVFDYLFGGTIPLNARQSTGGFGSSDAMGGIVRGIQYGRFDGYIKIIQNIDLRLNFPALLGIVPAVVSYFDAGLYDNLSREIVLDSDRLLFSTGAGLALNFSLFELGFYAHYFLNESLFSLQFVFSYGAHY